MRILNLCTSNVISECIGGHYYISNSNEACRLYTYTIFEILFYILRLEKTKCSRLCEVLPKFTLFMCVQNGTTEEVKKLVNIFNEAEIPSEDEVGKLKYYCAIYHNIVNVDDR